MLDINFIRKNPSFIKKILESKRENFPLDEFLNLDKKRRELIQHIDALRNQKNQANTEIKKLVQEKKDTSLKIEEMRKLSEELSNLEEEFKGIKEKFNKYLLRIPNICHSTVPVGDASANKIIKEKGMSERKKESVRSHIELAEHLGIIDFKVAAKICGAHFILFKGKGAYLVRALINFMLDLHTLKHGYTEVFPPFLVNRTSMTTTGQLPKLEEDMYRLKDDDYFLIPTAEVPVTNIHRGEILDEQELPLYYTAYTACFRREAGSYGKETRGLSRVHQFDKVELVKFVKPENSYEELEALLNDACEVIELLELPYRVVLLATQELSFAAAKCYDIEVYAPAMDKWLEVSSCSNFEDFQARRGNIRYREKETKRLRYVHTLNGSGVALARLIIALLENHQQKDGSIYIPPVLRPYMRNEERLTKD